MRHEAEMLSDVVGHAPAIALLRSHTTDPHHSYIFHGPEGVGKRFAAIQFFHELGVLAADTPDKRERLDYKVSKDTHPDMHILQLTGNSYGLVQIQEMIKEALENPREAPYRMYVVDHAEKLTPNAANALLKILEDSPERTIFIFVVEEQDTLIPTIRSRSVSVRYSALPTPVVMEYLGEYSNDAEKVRLCANLSSGSIGTALRYLRGGHLIVRDNALELLQTIHRRPYHQVLDAVENAESPESLFYLLRHLLADLARIGAGLEAELANFDKEADLRLVRSSMGEAAIDVGIDEMNGLYARLPRIKGNFPTHLKASLLLMSRAARG